MRGLYRAVLKLYPEKYRAAFAAEMIEIFNRTSVDFGKQGPLKLMSFTVREFTGLVKGLIVEHAAKRTARDAYLSSRCTAPQNTELPADVAVASRQLEQLLRSMEFAIAHHDFPRARFYSDEERKARATLQRLIGECKIEDQLVSSNQVGEF